MTHVVRRIAIASWAVLGVAVMLAEPAVRLALFAARHLRGGLHAGQCLALVATTATLGYLEGYRGFRCSFCPRVIEVAFGLSGSVRATRIAVAPLYALGLLGGTSRARARAWGLVAGIVLVVLGVRTLPVAARSIVDAAVSLSLAWGTLELCVRHLVRARREVRAAAPAWPSWRGWKRDAR
jgi:hypothetical protein